MSFPESSMHKKQEKGIGLLDIYGEKPYTWMLTLTWLRIFTISYKIRKVVEIPSTTWILKCNGFKLNSLFKKLFEYLPLKEIYAVACFNHCNFIPW